MTRCEMCKQPVHHNRAKVHPLCQAKKDLVVMQARFEQTHRMLCCVLASRNGYAKLTDDDLLRAKQAKFTIAVQELPGRMVELRLGDGVILPASAPVTTGQA